MASSARVSRLSVSCDYGVMKEILGKCTTKSSTLLTKITVNKTDIFDAAKIADEFNKFFTNIGTDLANKIPNA